MTGFPSLQELVSAELSRRQEVSVSYNPFSVIIHDRDPRAITSVEAAVAAIEARHETGGERVVITADILDPVCAGLESKHPALFRKLGRLSVIARVIIDSRRATAPVPTVEDALPAPGASVAAPQRSDGRADGDEVQSHYARRIAAMRDGGTVLMNWSNDVDLPGSGVENIPGPRADHQPPPQTPVERITEILERFFLNDQRLTTELLQELSRCTAAELVRLFGCSEPPQQPLESVSGQVATGGPAPAEALHEPPKEMTTAEQLLRD
jgi:hypothetical protein